MQESTIKTFAVEKFKDYLNYFYRYAKKFSTVKSAICPLLDSNGNLISDENYM